MTVIELKDSFFDSFGVPIRIYKTLNTSRGSKLADDDTKLIDLAASKNNFGDLFIKRDNTVGQIEDQFKDKLGIGIQIMLLNGVEFAPNDSIITQVQDIKCKEIKENEMALNISGRMKVKTLKQQFKDEFGLSMRVYDGKSFADDDATLASIRKGDSKGGEFSPAKNTKIGNFEDKMMDMFGIKTQISGSDNSYLCDNDLTLAKALEEDVIKMERKEKKAAKNEKKDIQAEDIEKSNEILKIQNNNSEELEEYKYITQINFGIIENDQEDLIDCFKTPSIVILSNDGYKKNIVSFPDNSNKEFEDLSDAYEYCADYIEDIGSTNLSSNLLSGLLKSASDEDEDGMYEILEEQGGEVLISQTIYLENLYAEAEDNLNNSDINSMPFCLIQHTEELVNISNGMFEINGDKFPLTELNTIPGYVSDLKFKVCIYVID